MNIIGHKKVIFVSLGASLLLITNQVMAKQSLEQAAEDPTASITTLQIADWYDANYHLSDADNNSLLIRIGKPFKTGNINHIFRASVPVITDSPQDDSGLADSTIFDLMVFDKSWGRWGVGAVALLPTGTDKLSAEKWAAGPAIGFTASDEKLLWGVFNQNLFTVAGDSNREDINMSSFQPIVSYSLGNGLSVGASEIQWTYDWTNSRWSKLPLGVKLAKLVHFGKLPVQLSAQYEYNFVDDIVTSKNTYRLTAKFML
jgi:hypothetical protein